MQLGRCYRMNDSSDGHGVDDFIDELKISEFAEWTCTA